MRKKNLVEESAQSVFLTRIMANTPEHIEFEDCYIKTTADTWGEQIINANPLQDPDQEFKTKIKTLHGYHFFNI